MDGLPTKETSKIEEENNKIIKTIIQLFPKKLPNWLLQKQQSEKLKLTQNKKNNFPMIFPSLELINIQNQLIKIQNRNRKQRRYGFCTRIELSKKLTVISVATEIMSALTQNLPKPFRKDWPRVSMLKSSRNQFKIIKEIDFGQDKLKDNLCS